MAAAADTTRRGEITWRGTKATESTAAEEGSGDLNAARLSELCRHLGQPSNVEQWPWEWYAEYGKGFEKTVRKYLKTEKWGDDQWRATIAKAQWDSEQTKWIVAQKEHWEPIGPVSEQYTKATAYRPTECAIFKWYWGYSVADRHDDGPSESDGRYRQQSWSWSDCKPWRFTKANQTWSSASIPSRRHWVLKWTATEISEGFELQFCKA